MSRSGRESDQWRDAKLAAALFAIAPFDTRGVVLKALPGPARDAWLDDLARLTGGPEASRRIPLSITHERLIGGLDLAATLSSGRAVFESGILEALNGRIGVLAMAERLESWRAATIAHAMDRCAVVIEREGMSAVRPTRFGLIAIDESCEDGDGVAPSLLDRLAFHVDLTGIPLRTVKQANNPPADVGDARALYRHVDHAEDILMAMAQAAAAFGVHSTRALILALAVARAHAALSGRTQLEEEDAVIAGRLVLGPRATSIPDTAPQPDERSEDNADGDAIQPEEPCDPGHDADDRDDTGPDDDARLEDLTELIVAAVDAAVPVDLDGTKRLVSRRSTGPGGGAGAKTASRHRGRPIGVRPGTPAGGARLAIVDTLRAAAPWQRVRQPSEGGEGSPRRIAVRREDLRIKRFADRTESETIFVVDASGSSAMNRLAEAKGAVEYLLADCYVRRDQVALIAMRGRRADLVLPPTRSLSRAKRLLAGLPGGGGTPMASGIEAALALADAARRRGRQPVIVLLTDGAANVARDGTGGRSRAKADALTAAKYVRANGIDAILIDTAPRASAFSAELAGAMDAAYHALPRLDAKAVQTIVRTGARPMPR